MSVLVLLMTMMMVMNSEGQCVIQLFLLLRVNMTDETFVMSGDTHPITAQRLIHSPV